MNVVLIGFMCTGKSRVGRLLAEKLGWQYIDTDEMVFVKTGSTPASIIIENGEPFFRKIEQEVVREVSDKDRQVISTGGGVPMFAENMAMLKKNGRVVCLDASPEVILTRAGDLHSRPLIDKKNPLESVAKRLKERTPFYSQADYSVDTDKISPSEVVKKIIQLLPELHE